MGKSGCGKTSLCLDLKERYGDKIHIVKSKTTRAERIEDPNDKESHIFCTTNDLDIDQAIAIYASPKGYYSWTDLDCFEEDKINLYTIDPKAFKDDLSVWAEDNDVELCGIYLALSESVRKRRYLQRGNDLEGFDSERHLALYHLDGLNNIIVIEASGSRKSTALQVEEIIEGMIV